MTRTSIDQRIGSVQVFESQCRQEVTLPIRLRTRSCHIKLYLTLPNPYLVTVGNKDTCAAALHGSAHLDIMHSRAILHGHLWCKVHHKHAIPRHKWPAYEQRISPPPVHSTFQFTGWTSVGHDRTNTYCHVNGSRKRGVLSPVQNVDVILFGWKRHE